ncbi:protein MIS12 homolog [Betta splendens]|uniref:Protein MIS12 homolog n=1 Tax=Betta splendens TaxID=158456 RepID=A0A6P7M0T5_BETSP|nr:protein MIS12 homolog [Betta splendens]
MARETREETEMEVHEEIDEETDGLSPSTLKLYEAQFFGFTPQTCMQRVRSAFQDCLFDILPVVEKVCVRQLSKGESDAAEEQLRAKARECSQKLQQYLGKRFKQQSERMEALLVDRCLSVPPNVLLPEDQCHSSNAQDAQEVQKLESSITDLQAAYEAEVCARRALLAELDEQTEAQKQLDGILAWTRELQAAWMKEGNGNFHESFRLLMDSVKKLQGVIGGVCKKAPR